MGSFMKLLLIDDDIDDRVFFGEAVRDINPEIAFELKKIINLAQIADNHLIIEFLIEEIEKILEKNYADDILFKQWISKKANLNISEFLIEYAKEIDLISSSNRI